MELYRQANQQSESEGEKNEEENDKAKIRFEGKNEADS
jgi:hypothetical protein